MTFLSKPKRAKGIYKPKIPGQMNSLEKKYAELLDADPSVVWFRYEGVRLKLSDDPKTFYTPDFFVLNEDMEFEAHEVKGKWEDDARVKIKWASQLYPFLFKAATKESKKNGGGWKYEYFQNA